jgi:hypothetical protein
VARQVAVWTQLDKSASVEDEDYVGRQYSRQSVGDRE